MFVSEHSQKGLNRNLEVRLAWMRVNRELCWGPEYWLGLPVGSPLIGTRRTLGLVAALESAKLNGTPMWLWVGRTPIEARWSLKCGCGGTVIRTSTTGGASSSFGGKEGFVNLQFEWDFGDTLGPV
jgi:hypothetical protein